MIVYLTPAIRVQAQNALDPKLFGAHSDCTKEVDMKQEYETVTLRLPPGLRGKLLDEAKRNYRSMNAHAVAVLSEEVGLTPSRPKPKGDEE